MALVAIGASVPAVGAPPDYDFNWVAVGAPGNRAATQAEAPGYFPPYTAPPLVVGAVDYTYRMSREEVTVGQWFEFVQAYAPYWKGSPGDSSFTGFWIWPKAGGGYEVYPGADKYPTDCSWHMAARYVNWLHNGKRTDRDAFEKGVYDTSTFTKNPDGSWNDQEKHDPGADFWIPTLDEWTKAMYYDPDRYGPGAEGYWAYPDGSDEPLKPGMPWDGGETSAGLSRDAGYPYLDVGSYPWVKSPWGLLDGSGGQREWTEWATATKDTRGIKGSAQFWPSPDIWDRLDWLSGAGPDVYSTGFRIASGIPSPGLPEVILLFAPLSTRRRSQ